MGGNALNFAVTRRYQKEEFLDILLEVRTLLSNKGIVSEVPKWYSNKDSFGDLDVLIKSSTLPENIIDVIQELFQPTEIYNNSDVKSFDYKDFQIDFIMTSDDKWETSINYFSYNDLGNFIGRIAYNMGFRFGHFGLKLVYLHPDGGRKFTKMISKEPQRIYEFLGFDHDRYLEGFEEVEDIFKFVVTSQRFNRRIFDYDQLNHQNRTRNRKRKNYELFLKYLETSDDVLPFNYEFKSKEEYIDEAEKFFGVELRSEIERWKEIVDVQKRASAKFNGHILMEMFPNLKGKELGNSIKKFRGYITAYLRTNGDTEFDQWILDNDLDHIISHFKNVNNL